MITETQAYALVYAGLAIDVVLYWLVARHLCRLFRASR
jgi:hypothetical protein